MNRGGHAGGEIDLQRTLGDDTGLSQLGSRARVLASGVIQDAVQPLISYRIGQQPHNKELFDLKDNVKTEKS
jgi:hypothetical protein